MLCNSCGVPINENKELELCDSCFKSAKFGSYAVCVNCEKVSFAVKPDDVFIKKILYSKTCLSCSGIIPEMFYEIYEKALEPGSEDIRMS